ncbi:hypothetical protein B4U79_17732 [Dinothrombium tinctorium]|uniref:Spaetzle domain-containing protein n=1 Tax=Dinothrombium tinctorium TaxID=1965070 RepID=A0A443R120_9ACAR|nr:hypothetical protein B4U79_17732 [Dinothrombium tinctorium]
MLNHLISDFVATPDTINGGVLKLIIKTYIEDLIATTSAEDELFKNKLLALGDHILTHPALYQKNLYVGNAPPSYHPDEIESRKAMVYTNSKLKRFHESANTTNQFPSEEVCTTTHQWEQLNQTHDLYNNPVDIQQLEGFQQFVFTYKCVSPKVPCLGISPIYHSECTERLGWMYMYYKKQGSDEAQWGFVASPHHCACKIQPIAKTVSPSPSIE